MMMVMVTMVKKNGNDSSATTSDGFLPLTNPVIVHLREKKMVGNKEGEGEKKRKEKMGDDGERIEKMKMTRPGRELMMQQLLSPENR